MSLSMTRSRATADVIEGLLYKHTKVSRGSFLLQYIDWLHRRRGVQGWQGFVAYLHVICVHA